MNKVLLAARFMNNGAVCSSDADGLAIVVFHSRNNPVVITSVQNVRFGLFKSYVRRLTETNCALKQGKYNS